MKRTISALFAFVALAPVSIGAQPLAHEARPPALADDPAIAALRTNWRQVTGYITRAAEQLSEADYSYRPIATVRTFGQLIAHVAGSQYTMCAAALGEKGQAEDAIEKTMTTKADLVAALKASTASCEKAYAQSGVNAAAITDLYGDKVPRYNALALNAVHNGEHYGNIITYMRMKGMVPPSSQR